MKQMYSAFQTGASVHHHSLVIGSGNEIIVHEEISANSDSDRPGRRVRYHLHPVRPLGDALAADSQLARDLSRLSSDTETDNIRVERALTKKKLGKRRLRRIANDYLLGHHSGQVIPASMQEAKEEWYSLFGANRETAFQKLFEDQQSMKTFEPFLNVTTDEQDQLLRQLGLDGSRMAKESTVKKQGSPTDPRTKPQPVAPPQSCPSGDAGERFRQIPQEPRRALRRMRPGDFGGFEDLERAVVAMVQSQAPATRLELMLSKKERFFCHVLSKYYLLRYQSKAMDFSGVSAVVTTVDCPTAVLPEMPSSSLVDFLQKPPLGGLN